MKPEEDFAALLYRPQLPNGHLGQDRAGQSIHEGKKLKYTFYFNNLI